MKAVIISAGDGTRLRPVTCSVPHCMLPVMGRPVIEHTLRLLHRHNITDVVIISSYLTDEIKKHLSFYPINDMKIDFIAFDDIVKLNLKDDLLFINDSLILDTDLSELVSVHLHSGSDATAVAMRASSVCNCGILCTGKEGFVTEYNRSPGFSQILGIPFTGVVVVKKGCISGDFRSVQTLMTKLLERNLNVYCHTPVCYIRDISDFDSYLRCCRDFMDKKINLPFPCQEKAPSVWIDEGATIMQGAVITPPVYIGKGSVINKGARVEAYTQILQDVVLDCNCNIKRSIVMDNSYVSEGVSLRGALLGRNCTIGTDCAAYEGSVVGFGTRIGDRSTIRTSVHIWPDKFIEEESVVSENLTWESTIRSNLLTPGKAEGIINRDLTPEFAVQLARALSCLFGEKIAVSCEDAGAGQMIKNALISGIQSGGGKAFDMGEQPLPITRSAVRFYSFDGAVSMSVKRSSSPAVATLDILDSGGMNIDKSATKKLCHLIDETASGKITPAKISSPEYLYEYKLFYLKKLINSTSKKPLRKKVLIHSPSIWAKELLKSAAKDLECSFTFTDNPCDDKFLQEITNGDYDLGAICDYRCEKLTLVTKDGHILSEFDYIMLTSLIIMKIFPSATIYAPETAPPQLEDMAKKHDSRIIRTSINPSCLMTELSRSDKKVHLHQFIYSYDAVGSIIILLDSISGCNLTIEKLIAEIPSSGIVADSVSVPKKEQSEVIKHLYLKPNAHATETEDAVRLNFKNGWVMVIGDKENSLLKIISHAQSKEYAREIADICIDDISDL